LGKSQDRQNSGFIIASLSQHVLGNSASYDRFDFLKKAARGGA
jgi:hypothetical protein